MFWGSIFWEKNWGTINADWYQGHICPLIRRLVRGRGESYVIQDGAPSHKARATKALLRLMGAVLLDWPAYSPDRNPIESLWDLMKD